MQRSWLSRLVSNSSQGALSQMRLGPEDSLENPLMFQFFTWDSIHDDMSWWKHLAQQLPELARLGITQVWVPPPTKAAHGLGGMGYDLYDLWDLGEFDQKGTIPTRWGTRVDLLQACQIAKTLNVGILIDAVLNHKMGADASQTCHAVPVNPLNRNQEVGSPRKIEGWTAFNFPGRKNKYSSFRWTQEHFSGIDWDKTSQQNAIYKLIGEKHRGWSPNVDQELGNYDYLMGANLDHRNPEVQAELIEWASWIMETTGAAGFRLDAVKHIDRNFLYELLKQTRKNGHARMFVNTGLQSTLNAALKASKGQTAYFDVPLHMNLHHASTLPDFDLRRILDNTISKYKPGDAVTFVDNHDTIKGQSLESWVEYGFKLQAYALILLRPEGYPCVFYGDLYPNAQGYNADIARSLKTLILARKAYAYGAIRDYWASKDCIGFVRSGDRHHKGCAVLIKKHDVELEKPHSIRMNVGSYANSSFRGLLAIQDPIPINKRGWGEFTAPSVVQVWVLSES